MIKRWLALHNGVLFIYNSTKKIEPSDVIYLKGCYVDDISDPNELLPYAVSITHQFSEFNEIFLIFKQRTKRNE